MSLSIPRLFRAALLAVASVVVPYSVAADLPVPGIAPAQGFRFTPQTGTAWYVDGSADGQSWNAVAGPFFAGAGPVDFVQPGTPGMTYRLRYVDPATLGHAPVRASGFSAMMENAGAPVEVAFLDQTRGILRIDDQHARTFTYTWVKTSPNDAEAILSGTDGTFTLLRMNFVDGHLGRWGMEDIPSPQAAAQIREPLDSGVFSFRAGRFDRRLSHTELPLDFTGSSILLNEKGRLTYAKFTTAETVRITAPNGATFEGTYTYDPSTAHKGELYLNFTGGSPLGLNLDLSAAGQGKFSEIQTPGAPGLGSPRNGTFTLPDQPVPPDNPDCPPPGLGGRSYVINDSSPCSLNFNGDGTGTETREVNGALEVTYFKYSYSRTGKNSARVSITFPGAGSDLIEEYHLDFSDDCGGSFKRESFSDGHLAAGSPSSGAFTPGGIAGRIPGQ